MKIKIHIDVAHELRYAARRDLSEDSTAPDLSKAKAVDGFLAVGHIDHGQISDHQDLTEIIISESGTFYSTEYITGRDNTDDEFSDVVHEDGENFVVFCPVQPIPVTRILWRLAN